MYISHNISNDKLASFKVQPKYKHTNLWKLVILHQLHDWHTIIKFENSGQVVHGVCWPRMPVTNFSIHPNFPAILPICFMWTCYVADFQKMTPAALHASKSSSFKRLKVKGTTSRYNAQVFFEPDYQCWISLQLIFLEIINDLPIGFPINNIISHFPGISCAPDLVKLSPRHRH